MNEQQINSLIDQRLREYDAKNRFTLTPINNHNHDGINSPRVGARSLIYNKKVFFQFTTTGNGSTTDTDLITMFTAVSNPTRVEAFGIAFTPTSGTSTTRVSFSGIAELGDCVTQGTINVGGTISSVIQICGGTEFVNPGSGTFAPSPFDSSGRIGGAVSTSNAEILVDRFTNNSVTFKTVIDKDWKMITNIIIT